MLKQLKQPVFHSQTESCKQLEVNILQPEDDEEISAMDCARLRPDGEYLDNSAPGKNWRLIQYSRPEDLL